MRIPIVAQAAQELPPLAFPDVAYSDIGPIIILVVGAMALLTIASLVRSKPARGFYALFTVCTAAAALISSAWLWHGLDEEGSAPRFAFSNMIAVDGFSIFFFVVISIAVVFIPALAVLLITSRKTTDMPWQLSARSWNTLVIQHAQKLRFARHPALPTIQRNFWESCHRIHASFLTSAR